MKRLLFAIPVLALLISAAALGATYYSQGSVAPNVLGSWNTIRGGGGTSPANFNGGDEFVIQNTHSMTTTAVWAVGNAGTVRIESGGTLTANHAFSVDVFQVNDGGTYNHNFSAPGGGNGTTDDFPGHTPYTVLSPASTVNINSWATAGAAAPAPLPDIAYGNLTINVPAWSGSLDMNIPDNGAMTVNGDLRIQATGGGSNRFCLSRNHTITLNVGGSFEIVGGTFSFTDGGTSTNYTLNIGKDIIINGGDWAQDIGEVGVHYTGGAANANATIAGTISGLNRIDWTVDAGKTLRLLNRHPVGDAREFHVFGRLNCDNCKVVGGGSFYLENGATLGINHEYGIFQGTDTLKGNIGVSGLRSFSKRANYFYYSYVPTTLGQTGDALPDTVNDLTIDHLSSIWLNHPCCVNGTLTLTAGEVLASTSKLSVASDNPVVRTSGFITGPLTLHVATGSPTREYPVSDENHVAYTPITLSFGNVTTAGMMTVHAQHSTITCVVNPANMLNRFWELDRSDSLQFDTYSATLNYLPGDFNTSFVEATDEATMVGAAFTLDFGPWALPFVDARFPGGPADGGAITLSGLGLFPSGVYLTLAKDSASVADLVPPQITMTQPADTAAGVVRGAPVTIAFSKPINPASLAFTSSSPDLQWAAHWNAGGDTVSLTHQYFRYGFSQTFEVTSAHDVTGNALVAGAVNNPFSFTVAGDPDTPYVVSTSPADGAGDVLLDQPIRVVFSERMDTTTFYIMCMPSSTGWTHSWSWTSDTLVLYHDAFLPEQSYNFGLFSVHDYDGFLPLTTGPAPIPFNFTTGTASGLSGTPGGPPEKFYFNNAAPNPAIGGNVRFDFGLPQACPVKLMIYNAVGQRIATVVDGSLPAGRHTVRWNGSDQNGRKAASGVYIYKLQAGNNQATKKLIVVK